MSITIKKLPDMNKTNNALLKQRQPLLLKLETNSSLSQLKTSENFMIIEWSQPPSYLN